MVLPHSKVLRIVIYAVHISHTSNSYNVTLQTEAFVITFIFSRHTSFFCTWGPFELILHLNPLHPTDKQKYIDLISYKKTCVISQHLLTMNIIRTVIYADTDYSVNQTLTPNKRTLPSYRDAF